MHTYQEKTSRSQGFTLIELLVTIAIAAIITSIGIPGFTGIMRSNRLTTNINQLVTSLSLARSEAVKRNQPITVRRTNANWEGGWTVFTDLNGNGTLDVGDNDTLLRTFDTLPNGYTLRATYANSVTYQASGISPSGNFILCENSDGNNIPETNTARFLIVNSVGRAAMGMDNNNDGIFDIESPPGTYTNQTCT